MLSRTTRSRNFFRELVVNGVNGVSSSKTAIQNDCLMRLYDADAELKAISTELDSFDGKKDPIRCNLLVNQLRTAQDKVISLLFQLMDDCNCERASRDYRMKFPDEILLSEGSESLNGQIWFGAECLSAGSNILNHTKESTMLRPMAKTLTTHLDSLRNDLRDLVLDGGGAVRISQALIKKMSSFDHIFATFEYEYVRTMLPIRTIAEIEKLQEVAVLFSETLIDCVKRNLIKQDDIDEFQPIVMIAIPRLAIVRGLLYKNENPIYTRHKSQMCSLFQPFHGPLHSIRRLLRGLNPRELFCLEKMLANDQSAMESPHVQLKETTIEETNYDDDEQKRLQEQDASTNEYSCGLEEEAGTSNNYSNVLMEGLQYPVGQKRDVQIDNQDSLDTAVEQEDYSCCFDGHASSSKSVTASKISNSSSSPSTSSSLSTSTDCKRCDDKNLKCNEDCDKNCCMSPPESDGNLEKLIAELDPSLSNQEQSSTKNEKTMPSPVVTNSCVTEDTRRKDSALLKNNQDEALLEELFVKQAQQLLHRLFVAISGVADQLQSNFASDLRFILKHIFSTDENGEDDIEATDDEDSDDREFSIADNSDSSLAIEQGIEAREVANLIDLEDGYSLAGPFNCDVTMLSTPPPPAGYNSYVNNLEGLEQNYFSPSSSLYTSPVANQTTNNSNQTSTRSSQSTNQQLNQNVTEDLLADLMRSTNQGELLYESHQISPNETSVLEDIRHHQQLINQHMQTLPRVHRSSSSRAHYRQMSSENTGSNLQVDSRRSRHHSSRSRRQRGPPVWVPDQLVVACSCCNSPFTLFRRRHHCRACGQIFCADCSKFTKNLNCWGYNGPVRVCGSCFNQP